MYCQKCGTEIDTRYPGPDGTLKCPQCGMVYRPVNYEPVQQQYEQPAQQQTESVQKKIHYEDKEKKSSLKKIIIAAAVILTAVILTVTLFGSRSPYSKQYALIARFVKAYNNQDIYAMIDCYEPMAKQFLGGMITLAGGDANIKDILPYASKAFGASGAMEDVYGKIKFEPYNCIVDGSESIVAYHVEHTLNGKTQKLDDEAAQLVQVNGEWYFSSVQADQKTLMSKFDDNKPSAGPEQPEETESVPAQTQQAGETSETQEPEEQPEEEPVFEITELTGRGHTTVTGLSVRKYPDESSECITVLNERNQKFDVSGYALDSDGQTWYRVDLVEQMETGFIDGQYFVLDEDTFVFDIYDMSGTVHTTKPGTNVRKDADESSECIAVLEKENQSLPVTGNTFDLNGTTWYRVVLPDQQTGFISEMDIAFDSNTSETQSPENQSAQEPVYEIHEISGKGYNTTGAVNVRTEPDTNSERVTLLKEMKQSFPVTGYVLDSEGQVWYRLVLPDQQTGFINGKYFKYDGDTSETPEPEEQPSQEPVPETTQEPVLEINEISGTGHKTVARLNARREPNGDRMMILEGKNKSLQVTGYTYDSDGTIWYRVILPDEQVGFVNGNYFELDGEQ